MTAKEKKTQEPSATSSESSLAFKYHRDVHTRELKEFVLSAYGITTTVNTGQKSEHKK